MARPREFDIEEALALALDVFWIQGYDTTSMTDLMDATGLAKGSIYKGYGDKKRLFMRALDSYLAQANSSLRESAEASGSGREALEQIFSNVVDMSTGKGVRRGCFSVNSTIELCPHDPDVHDRLRRNTQEKEKTFAAIIRKGIADGSLRKDIVPNLAGAYLTTVLNGLQVRGKLGLTKRQANQTVEIAMRTFV